MPEEQPSLALHHPGEPPRSPGAPFRRTTYSLRRGEGDALLAVIRELEQENDGDPFPWTRITIALLRQLHDRRSVSPLIWYAGLAEEEKPSLHDYNLGVTRLHTLLNPEPA